MLRNFHVTAIGKSMLFFLRCLFLLDFVWEESQKHNIKSLINNIKDILILGSKDDIPSCLRSARLVIPSVFVILS